MRVVTWNIRHALGNDGYVDLERIVAVISECEPDIVGLQEVDRLWSRSAWADQTAWLANSLGMSGVFGANLFPSEGGEYGTAILSRWPFTESANHPLPSRSGLESRGRLVAQIHGPDGQRVQVECTHLHWGGHQRPVLGVIERHDQATALVGAERPAELPIVLLGDFNAQPEDRELEPLREAFTDAWAAIHPSEPGFTIPSHPTEPPDRRIDYLWLSAGIRCLGIEVVDTAVSRMASDHYPVIADLELPTTPG